MDHTGGTNYLYFNGYIAPGLTQDNSGTNPSLYTTSPDIFDPSMTAFSMAWIPSPDGGKFAHMLAWLDGENQEGIFQTLTELTIGMDCIEPDRRVQTQKRERCKHKKGAVPQFVWRSRSRDFGSLRNSP